MKTVKRALSFLLVLGLFAGPGLTGGRADPPGEEITVSSAEELQALAQQCSLDTWSRGKTVRLTADIDLSGQAFSPIPTFGGTFLGEGHTISGINLTASGSNMGLFRFVQKGAVIQDLHVSGRVAPGGSQTNVGGIAGSNEGVILSCGFRGAVRGESAVGGVAGRNGPNGEIALCSAAGSVTGKNGTGGIAGRSDGLLLQCENSAGVNTSDPGPSAGLESLNVGEALSQLATPTDDGASGRFRGSHTDTGGVVGFSAGVVQGCSNTAAVGYSHVGYNVGGVAGRQTGYMAGCSNSGDVRGRKDVGGVIGQAEPDVTLNAGEDAMSRLRQELGTLSGLLAQAMDHTDLSRGDLSARLSAMAGNADSARESARLLLEQTAGLAEGYVSSVNALRAAAAAALEDLSFDRTDLSGAAEAFGALRDALEEALQSDPEPPDRMAREAGNELFSSLSGLASDMEALRSGLDSAGETLSADLRAVNRQMELVFALAIDALDEAQAAPEIPELIGDASDENIDDTRLGKAAECVNTGSVEGDRNVGGVVGAMAIEYDLDPEDDNTRFSFGSYYEIKAVLQNCVNLGAVTGRRDCVGGLAGRMDLGTVTGCVNYGAVVSTGGSYVGGVAGYSGAAVHMSWAKCSLSGENYVGGVAGWARSLTDCRAIVVIGGGTQYVGSIAGAADVESGGVRGNCFVDMGVAGVDGVSYAGIAEPVSYDGLLELPDVPAGFSGFTLTLRADGETVARFPFRYGEDLSDLPLPEVPARDGFYGAWPEFDRSGTRSDLTVDAVYTPWVTLAASARREGKLPLVLAEGLFFAEAAPEVRDSALAPPDGERGEDWDIWEITMTGTELTETDSVPLRLLNRSGGKARVWQYVGGRWEEVEARANGHYLLLTMSGTSGVFCIRPVPDVSPLVPGLPLAAAGLCVILLAVRKRRAAKRKTAEIS